MLSEREREREEERWRAMAVNSRRRGFSFIIVHISILFFAWCETKRKRDEKEIYGWFESRIKLCRVGHLKSNLRNEWEREKIKRLYVGILLAWSIANIAMNVSLIKID